MLTIAGVINKPTKFITLINGLIAGPAAVFTFHYFVGITLSALFIRNHHVDLKFAELSIFYIRIALISILTIMPLWVLRDYLPGGNIIRLITVLVSNTKRASSARAWAKTPLVALLSSVPAR